MKRLLAVMLVVLCGCSNANMPRTTVMGVPVGGGSSYCVALSSGVGALAGGILAAFLAPTQTVQSSTIGTFSGAAAGGAAGYAACGPTTSATQASEPKPI